ncbi:single-stranded DNA-binding protein [Curtobacterium albidum]|uniref:Single-stranded DNA-binding protein n=1 Tax=Curtobacterium citreum TaxID=2036 RepID=A0A850DUU9_9MICO|nr:single-stranded DNA-binding protein [Curtobacterium albidum]NUU27930.1 single-stranded DNA-binding protein [Curtobacterium albidum]
MSKATMTVEGWAVQPRDNRTQAGNRVVSVRVAHSWSKKLDTGGYENVGGTTWAEAAFWGADADYVASRVTKGTYVTLSGDPEVQTYEGRDGVGVTVILRNPTIGIDDRRSRVDGQSGRGAAVGNPAAAGTPREPWSPQTGGQQNQGWPTQQPGQQGGGAQGQDIWSQPNGDYQDETPF